MGVGLPCRLLPHGLECLFVGRFRNAKPGLSQSVEHRLDGRDEVVLFHEHHDLGSADAPQVMAVGFPAESAIIG